MTSKTEDDSKMEDALKNRRPPPKPCPPLQKSHPHLKNVTRTAKNGRRPQKTDDDLERRTTTSKDKRRARQTHHGLQKQTPTAKTAHPHLKIVPPPKCSLKSSTKSRAKSSTKSSTKSLKKGRPEAGYRAALSSQKNFVIGHLAQNELNARGDQ